MAIYNTKLSNILYDWQLTMASFRFCETHLLHIKPFVVNKSAISPFLAGCKKISWVFPSPPLFFGALSELTLPPEDGLSDIFLPPPPFPPSHRVSLSHLNQTHAKEAFYLSILIGHFLQKSAIIGGSFAERDLQFKASYASAWGQKVKLNQSHANEAIFLI